MDPDLANVEFNGVELKAKFFGNSSRIVTRVVLNTKQFIPGLVVMIGNQHCGIVPDQLLEQQKDIEIVCLTPI